MRMLNDAVPFDLTYSDVFMVPSLSAVPSRFDVDLTTPDALGTTIPVVVANMTAVAGRRMAETVARRGGITVLPQDIPLDVVESVVDYVKSRHTVYETPITLGPHHTVGDALGLIHKRAHGAVVVVDDNEIPLGIFTEHDAVGFDRFTQLQHVARRDMVAIESGTDPRIIHERLADQRLSVAPVVDDLGRLIGCVTRKGALRSTIYRPAVDADGRLRVACAVGINGDPAARARPLRRHVPPQRELGGYRRPDRRAARFRRHGTEEFRYRVRRRQPPQRARSHAGGARTRRALRAHQSDQR